MKQRTKLNQQGIVSFLITMIMMIVISLIVLGFAQVARRNQREALDRQLSTQAYYAAESGVNDATSIIKGAVATGTVTDQATCNGATYPAANLNPPDNSVGYTCILVDSHLKNLVYTTVSRSQAIIAPITTNTALKSLTFSWDKQPGTGTSCSGHLRSYFPPLATYDCSYGILRVDLVQVADPSSPPTSAAALANVTDTFYLTPFGGNAGTLYSIGTSLAFGTPNTVYYGSGCDGNPTTGTCGAVPACNNTCQVTIPLSGATQYYARITSLYRDPPRVTINGVEDAGTAKFLNSQVSVDATGKAQDVLRRIQVRLGLGPKADGGIPLNALGSATDICKHFTVVPGDPEPSSTCE